MTVKGGPEAPDLESAAAQLGVPTSALNAAFGVVPIDPDNHLYAVEVSADAKPSEAEDYRGPFSNPRIEAFTPAPPADRDKA